MIRREVQLVGASLEWLLISQVEHARLSGELAARCLDQFGEPGGSLDAVRQELLQAIFHHDDGWAEWETSPQLDASGRPLSFMEVASDDALGIWDRSIRAAERFGNLAAWAVAGHFSALLATVGEHSNDPAAREWLRDTAARRTDWFGRWHSSNPSVHTAKIAGEALKWVQLFDLLSLWPCSQYAVLGELNAKPPAPFPTASDWIVVREIRPGMSTSRIVFDPWPFDEREIILNAKAQLAPVGHYSTSQQLIGACHPFVAEWVLTPPE